MRRFVDRAGVVKLTTKAMWRLGTQFGQVSSALMGDAMIEALCMVLKYPDHVDLFNNAPPPRVLLENYDLQHVIIPRQFCQSQVYRQRINPGGSLSHADAVWIPREGSSVEEEQREAIAAYSGDDVISYSDSGSDEAFFSDEDNSHWSADDDEEEDLGWVEEDSSHLSASDDDDEEEEDYIYNPVLF